MVLILFTFPQPKNPEVELKNSLYPKKDPNLVTKTLKSPNENATKKTFCTSFHVIY